MLFTSEYSMKMPLFEALMTSLVGIVTVICILAIIAVLIILVSKVIRGVENAAAKKKANAAPVAAAPAAAAPAGKPTGVIPVAGVSQGTIDLVNVDEKTAAIIMAIVSDTTGVPLERLDFTSIRLIKEN